MTPTEYLVMEVLAARYRTGERFWTFPTFALPAVRRLEARNYVSWKHGVVEKTVLVRLSEEGVKAWKLDKPYQPVTEGSAA